MKRQAILIAVSPKSDTIPSVFDDISCWQNFLRSDIGGGWDEPVIAKNYGRKEILSIVNAAKDAEYSFLVFAGHGKRIAADRPWPETELRLSDDDTILERELNPGTPSCTLILDCWRSNSGQGETAKAEINSLHEDVNNRAKCRDLYDQSIKRAERGLVSIYAPELKSASDDRLSFSQCLVREAVAWAQKNHGVLSIQSGVALATKATRNISCQPEYNGGRRLRHFPLAVRI